MSTEVISLLIALAAVFVGPIVTLRVADRHIRATVRSTNRQHWIHEVRGELSALLAILAEGSIYAREVRAADRSVGRPLMRDAVEKRAKMVLLLNPKEDLHKELVRRIDAAMDSMTNPEASTDTLFEAVVSQAQTILKAEWVRVKRLD
jgi:hypothetical protein